MTNEILITFADQDQIVVAGYTPVIAISTSARGNGTLGLAAANAADQDKQKFRRYFARSGLYKFKLVYAKASDAGKLDVGLDSSTTNILSQLDLYNASTTYNNIIEKTIEIARGAHDIVFLINGKNASSSDYTFLMQLVEFDLIAEYPVAGESGAPGTDFKEETIEVALSDDNATSVPTAGVKYTGIIGYNAILLAAQLAVKTAGTGATLVEADALVESALNSDSFSTIFTTRPTIDASEFTSESAATPLVLNPAKAKLTKGTRMQYKIQAVDSNNLVRGMKLSLQIAKAL